MKPPILYKIERHYVVLLALGIVFGFGLSGCAGSLRPADQLLRQGDYVAAVAAYRAEEARNPDDAEVKRNLGAALWHSGQADEAKAKLIEAGALVPTDAQTHLLLARVREKSQEPRAALASYTDYLENGGKHDARVRQRMEALTRELARTELRSAEEFEHALTESLGAHPPRENTLAVTEFANVSGAEELAGLSRALAAVLITDLSKVEAFRVLERQRIQVLIDELAIAAPHSGEVDPRADAPVDLSKLNSIRTIPGQKQRFQILFRPGTTEPYYSGPIDESASPEFVHAVRDFQRDQGTDPDGILGPRTVTLLADAVASLVDATTPGGGRTGQPDTSGLAKGVVARHAPKIGWVLKARHLVQGSFLALGSERIQLDSQIAETVSGAVETSGPAISGPTAEVLRLEKQLVYQILDYFGIEPTRDERRRIDELATESFLALLAYGRGLQFEDRGDYGSAALAYEEAAAYDGGFQEPSDRLEVVDAATVDEAAEDQAQILEITHEELEPKIVIDIVGQIGGGPTPEDDPDDGPGIDPSGVTGPETPTGDGSLPDFPGTPWEGGTR